jgi:hypothetical protein
MQPRVEMAGPRHHVAGTLSCDIVPSFGNLVDKHETLVQKDIYSIYIYTIHHLSIYTTSAVRSQPTLTKKIPILYREIG